MWPPHQQTAAPHLAACAKSKRLPTSLELAYYTSALSLRGNGHHGHDLEQGRCEVFMPFLFCVASSCAKLLVS